MNGRLRQFRFPLAVLAVLVGLIAAFAAAGKVAVLPGAVLAGLAAAVALWMLRPADAVRPASPQRPEPFDSRLLDSVPVPIILLGAKRQVAGINRAARDLLGGGGTGRDLAVLLRHPAVLEAADAVIAGGPARILEMPAAAPVPRTFEVSVAPMPAEAPAAAKAVVILHDVTTAKKAEQMRADFVANVSHELRSPLSALVGFIETLKGAARRDEEARARFLDIMDAEASRMTRLIEDLLSLSRVEINEHVRPSGRVDIRAALQRVADSVSLKTRDRKTTLSIEVPDDLPAVAGDQDELVQVFQNLVDNAIKYSPDGSVVRAVARRIERVPEVGSAGVSVSIIDQGEGIPPEHIPRLTERFYRVDKGRSRRLGGTGLGLAIVKHIVNRHRGRLNVESVPNEGSTFIVVLPVDEDDRRHARIEAERLGGTAEPADPATPGQVVKS